MANENKRRRAIVGFLGIVGTVALALIPTVFEPIYSDWREKRNELTATVGQIDPTPVFSEPGYSLNKEQLIGDFVVQLWRAEGREGIGFDGIVTISTAGANPLLIERVDNVHKLDAVTGNDITGEGNPDVVIHSYTGGAHCCASTVILDLGSPIEKLLDSHESNCMGEVRDIGEDGIYEFVTCEDRFVYFSRIGRSGCSYAWAPLPPVVYRYDSAVHRYIPDTPGFYRAFHNDIVASTSRAEDALAAADLGPDEKLCMVLDVVLDHLYTGNYEMAWSEFDRLYQEPDADEIRTRVQIMVDQSPLYVRARAVDE